MIYGFRSLFVRFFSVETICRGAHFAKALKLLAFLFQYDYTFDWTMLKQKAALSGTGVEGAANGTTQPPTTPGGR